jgi:hypothetical protein
MRTRASKNHKSMKNKQVAQVRLLFACKMAKDSKPQDLEDEERCPVCRSTRFLNPSLVLFVSPCFHKMCQSCITRIFAAGSAPCPQCKTILRKNNFVQPTFEDMYVEKECGVRRRVSKM